jgi:hypothetical protein
MKKHRGHFRSQERLCNCVIDNVGIQYLKIQCTVGK